MVSLDKKNIVLLAGEASGDILGAGLIIELKKLYPNSQFWGIGGPQMTSLGFKSLYPMHRLSVMGLFEPLKRLPELLKIRSKIIQKCLKFKPDIFIGIDSPDFNLNIEKKLKENNIKTIHYVGPSVWAWRQSRIFKIKKATDLVLLLFPFEQFIYENHQVKHKCVGHLAAQQIPVEINKLEYKRKLGLDGLSAPIVAILPGSRQSVLKYHLPIFFQSMQIMQHLWFKKNKAKLQFITAMPNEERLKQFDEYKRNYFQIIAKSDTIFLPEDIKIVKENAREALGAADFAILASGTVSLEAMLMKTPMVVAYKMSWLTYQIAKRLVKTTYIALPNLLANRFVVPELIQQDANAQTISTKTVEMLSDLDKLNEIRNIFTELHRSMLKDTNKLAAEAVCDILESKLIN